MLPRMCPVILVNEEFRAHLTTRDHEPVTWDGMISIERSFGCLEEVVTGLRRLIQVRGTLEIRTRAPYRRRYSLFSFCAVKR